MTSEQKIFKITSIIPIISIVIFSITSVVGFYYTSSQNNRTELDEIKSDYILNQKKLLKDEMNTVYNYIEHKIDTLSDKLTQKELQQVIMNDISILRFGENGYFFIYSYDGVSLMHPMKPDLVGKNLYNLKDKNGVYLIQKLIDAAKNGGDYVNYMWDNPSTKKLSAKLGYAKGLDSWQWMIGTGVYLDDIQSVLQKKEKKLTAQSIEILQHFTITSFVIMIIMSIILFKLMGKLESIVLQYNQKLLNYQKDLEVEVQRKTKEINDKNIELKYKVYHDNLTDSLNRVSLQEYMKDTTKTVSLAILDIKEFSKINNIYGEYAGDEILKRFANALGELFSDEHYITYRISGDKFAILNKESIEENEYKKIIRSKVNSFIDKPLSVVVNHEVLDIVLQCIVGIAKGAASEKLIEHADMALNNAKVRCKQIVIYSEELHIEDVYKEDMRITQEVKSAIKEDRVVPFFQLIEKGEEKSYECLVRIKNNDGSILPPNKFLPVIMQTGYYTKITKIMIEKSFEYFSKTDYSFSINLSFKDISSTSIREFIKTKIKQYSIESQLILEILESESIENFDIVRDFIKDMKSLGVKIAIDDFGSGYSNFTYLIEVKPDFVKIDGSLIKDMDNDQNAYIMVKNISRFLKEMNLKTIAEYVHSKDIYDITKELDFDGIQGYYLSEPLEDVL